MKRVPKEAVCIRGMNLVNFIICFVCPIVDKKQDIAFPNFVLRYLDLFSFCVIL